MHPAAQYIFEIDGAYPTEIEAQWSIVISSLTPRAGKQPQVTTNGQDFEFGAKQSIWKTHHSGRPNSIPGSSESPGTVSLAMKLTVVITRETFDREPDIVTKSASDRVRKHSRTHFSPFFFLSHPFFLELVLHRSEIRQANCKILREKSRRQITWDPQDAGSPPSRLLPCMSKVCREGKAEGRAHSTGRLPEKLQSPRKSCVRFERPLSDQFVGRLPENRLEERSRYSRAAGGSPKPLGTGPSKLHTLFVWGRERESFCCKC